MTLVPNQTAAHGRLVLLAPPGVRIPSAFAGGVEINSHRHEHLLLGAQRLRARVYVEDGAIRESEVGWEGRHRHPADELGWHVLSLNRDGEVCGCSRYLAHSNTVSYQELGVRKAALAHSREWGIALRAAIDLEVAMARHRGLAYVEVGGWALDPTIRRTAEAVRIALATYGLARILGGCVGITTATRRHCSAEILRRIGGQPLRIGEIELPPYFDPQYECEMELLRFDSEQPNPRFEPWIEDLRRHLSCALVVQSPEEQPEESVHPDPSRQPWRRKSWTLGKDLVHAVQ
jgi:hypothetical protein